MGERLDASQLVAVEIEPRFAEILDLRLGLAYSDGLSPTNRPAITIGDFSDIAQTALTDVSLVLVNPPFQSRARSMSSDHVDFLRFISAIAQAAEEHPAVKSARLTGGQHGLEKLFLELLALRAKPGTTVAAIIPKKLLTAPGRDGDAFRAFLLDTFGLREIFTYPSTDLFSEFVVETAIIVGRIPVAGECDWQIEATQLLHTVPQLRGKRIRPGVNAVSEITSRGALGDRLRDWRDTLMPAVGALLEEIRGVAADRPEPYRGTYGNLGLSGELAFRNPEHVAAFGAFPVPLQRSGEPPRLFSAMTTAEWTIAAEDATAFTEERLASLWRTIHYTPGARTPQKKRLKTEHELPRILGLSRTTREIALLIPRAQRAVGQISIFVPTPQHPRAVISTNYLILEQESVQKAKVLGSWLLSVFGQLMLEYFSKPERGLRKLESEGVRRVVLPNLSKIPAVVQRQLSELFDIEEAIRFGPEERRTPRDVDRVWAQVLFEDRAQQLLAAAYDGLEELLRDRHQGR